MTQTISLKRTNGILPDGVYKLRVEKVEVKQGQKAPYIALQLLVVGKTTKVYENVSTAEAARFRLEQFLDAIEAPAKGNLKPNSLRGKTFWAKLTNESYQGRLKNTIDTYLTPAIAEQLLADQPPAEDDDDEETGGTAADEEGDEEQSFLASDDEEEDSGGDRNGRFPF